MVFAVSRSRRGPLGPSQGAVEVTWQTPHLTYVFLPSRGTICQPTFVHNWNLAVSGTVEHHVSMLVVELPCDCC